MQVDEETDAKEHEQQDHEERAVGPHEQAHKDSRENRGGCHHEEQHQADQECVDQEATEREMKMAKYFTPKSRPTNKKEATKIFTETAAKQEREPFLGR